MTEIFTDAQFQQISTLVAGHLGLHFPPERWPDLQRAICGAAEECGCQHDLDRYVQELLLPTLTVKQLDVLASYLTVGETYFFREKRSLEVFEKNIVPELIRKRTDKSIRVWSAGCATGEEPYSIAITLSMLMAGLEKWNVEILATDLNSKSLQKASEGIYGEWSFRGVPPGVRSACFEAVKEGRWAIRPAIKKMVNFAQLNLVEDGVAALSNLTARSDVIFCRNVLMYFTPDGRAKVIQKLYRSLARDGWLIVSPTETSHELFSEFAAISFGDVTLYRKSTQLRKSATLLSVVHDENGPGSRLPERRFENPEPAKASVRDASQQGEDHEVHAKTHAENVEPPVTSYRQALALYELGRYEDARQAIERLLSQNGNDTQAMLLLAHAYANEGKLAAALVWCDKAIAADKMTARAHYLRATILQERGSLPEALFAFKQTVYAEPQFVLAHFSLGNLALKHGKVKDSEKHFENVLLLLAQYEPEDIVPESDGLSAARLREIIVAGRGGPAVIAPEEFLRRTFRRGGKPDAEQSGRR
ncbi:MAG: CheR family methyltransferase [Candidatus Sulfotelmatobacter sp.]